MTFDYATAKHFRPHVADIDVYEDQAVTVEADGAIVRISTGPVADNDSDSYPWGQGGVEIELDRDAAYNVALDILRALRKTP